MGTLEQPLQRTLPGMGGGGGRWGTGASAVSELWTGPEGLTGRGAMACRTVPWLGMNMVAGAWVGRAAGTAADRRGEREGGGLVERRFPSRRVRGGIPCTRV